MRYFSLLHSALFALIILTIACTRSKEKFISEERHKENLLKQTALNSEMLQQLGEYGVNDKSSLNLNVYFFSDDSLKTQLLSEQLSQSGYHLNTIHRSAKDKGLWVLTGSSPTVNMDSVWLNKWSLSLCELSYQKDCVFQGWNPVPE